MKSGVPQIVKSLLGSIQDRYREVVDLRYGLSKPETATLAAIGSKYGVTRERIRQLEAAALQELQKAQAQGDFAQFIKTVVANLKSIGGVRKEADLISDIKNLTKDEVKDSSIFANQVSFLLTISGQVLCYNEDKDFNAFWYTGEDDIKKAKDFIAKIVKQLKNQKQAPSDYLSDLVSANYVSVSKKFGVNSYGDFGLTEWAHIAPENARDWAYLVLSKAQKPMHFIDIAAVVNKSRNKNSNPQTIHNELIKDENFVLVGKGTYALKEHGYIPGVARDVIARLLKKHGPLKSDDVIDLVNKERLFKKNTVLINLQNKIFFKRTDDGRYVVREA